MKTLLTLISIIALSADAGTVRLAWEASITPDVEYVVFAHTNAITETTKHESVAIINVSTNLTGDLDGLWAGPWHFRVVAQKGGLQSDLSNEVVGEMPEGPSNAQLIPLVTLTNGGGGLFFQVIP